MGEGPLSWRPEIACVSNSRIRSQWRSRERVWMIVLGDRASAELENEVKPSGFIEEAPEILLFV